MFRLITCTKAIAEHSLHVDEIVIQGDIKLVDWESVVVGPQGTGVNDLEKLSLKPNICFPSAFSTSLSLSAAEWCPLLRAPRSLALSWIKLGDNEKLQLHDFLLYLYFLKANNEFNLTERAQEHNPLVSQSVHDHGLVLQSLVETLEVRRHVD